mmetsp:Transcript_150618/g.419860  ORF Transcript_150618/g.419860 Transcript_150618/m.419860 type:complete len:207 (+) Transcript_150618:74-694(+)
MSFVSWWDLVRKDHVVLGIWHCANRNGPDASRSMHAEPCIEPFSLFERFLCLGCAFACAWFGVYIKYFYLTYWVPIVADEVFDELSLFPNNWAADHIDSALCAVGAGAMDFILGKEVVRTVLRKDWEHKGGAKGFLSFLASAWAVVLTVSSMVHISTIVIERKREVQFKLGIKLITTLIVKFCVIETAIITAKTFLKPSGGKRKDA